MRQFDQARALAIVLLCLLPLAGCALQEIARKDDVAAAKTDLAEEILKIRSENSALSERLEATTHQIEDLTAQINASKREMADSARFIQERLQQLGSSLEQAKQDQQKISTDFSGKIQVVLDEVSKENSKLHERIDKLGEKKSAPRSKKSASNKTTPDTGNSYTVAPGDTLVKIAKRHGVSLSALMAANSIENPNDLKTGQKLVLP